MEDKFLLVSTPDNIIWTRNGLPLKIMWANENGYPLTHFLDMSAPLIGLDTTQVTQATQSTQATRVSTSQTTQNSPKYYYYLSDNSSQERFWGVQLFQ